MITQDPGREGYGISKRGARSKSGECYGHWTESKWFRMDYKAREKSLRCIHLAADKQTQKSINDRHFGRNILWRD